VYAKKEEGGELRFTIRKGGGDGMRKINALASSLRREPREPVIFSDSWAYVKPHLFSQVGFPRA